MFCFPLAEICSRAAGKALATEGTETMFSKPEDCKSLF